MFEYQSYLWRVWTSCRRVQHHDCFTYSTFHLHLTVCEIDSKEPSSVMRTLHTHFSKRIVRMTLWSYMLVFHGGNKRWVWYGAMNGESEGPMADLSYTTNVMLDLNLWSWSKSYWLCMFKILPRTAAGNTVVQVAILSRLAYCGTLLMGYTPLLFTIYDAHSNQMILCLVRSGQHT